MDICEVIQSQHDEQRTMFAVLEEWPRDDAEGLAAVWSRLSILLETHAEAEERYFYPVLLARGTGAADADGVADQVEDAISDHNTLRASIRRAEQAKTGSDDWWAAVIDANVANSTHMGEEERQDLADFRQQATLQQRHDVAVAFYRYMALHAGTGITATDKDSDEYVADGGGQVAEDVAKAPRPVGRSLQASETGEDE